MLLISEMLDPKVQLICCASVIKWGLHWNFFVKRQIQEHVAVYSLCTLLYAGPGLLVLLVQDPCFQSAIAAGGLMTFLTAVCSPKIRSKYLHSVCIDVLQQWQKGSSLHGWDCSSCLSWPLAVVKLMHVQIYDIDLCSVFHTMVSCSDICPFFRGTVP